MDYDSEFYDGLYDNNNDDKKYLLALSQSDQYKEPLIKKDQYDPLDIVLFSKYSDPKNTIFYDENRRPFPVTSNMTCLSEEEKNFIQHFRNYLKNNLFEWQGDLVQDYKFNLPDTAFAEAKQIELVQYTGNEVDYEDNSNEKLSEDNLKDIALKGEFSIKSSKGKVYVWKLSKWLMQGSECRKNNFDDDIGIIFEMMYYYKYRFNEKFKYANIQRVFKNCYYLVRDLFRLFYGTPCVYNNKGDETPLKKEYFNELLSNIDYNTKIFHPNARKIATTIFNEASTIWKKKEIDLRSELKQKGLEDKEIKTTLLNKRFQFHIEYMKKNKEFQKISESDFVDFEKNDDEIKVELLGDKSSNEEKEERKNILDNISSGVKDINNYWYNEKMQKSLFKFFTAQNIFWQIQNDHLNKVDKMKKDLHDQIKKDHPILSKTNPWFNKTYFTEEIKRIEQMENDRNIEINEKLKDYPEAVTIFNSYLEYQKTLKHKLKDVESPRHTSYYYFRHLNPVLKKTEENIPYYYKELDSVSNIPTNTYFWRIKHMVYFTLQNQWNSLIWSYNSLFRCSLGITSLFTSKLKDGDYYVKDSVTGEIEETYTNTTYIKGFIRLGDSIRESVDQYERNKNTNFFGPGFGKFVNIFENYICKALIYGTLYTIFYPIFVILWCLFVICLEIFLITFWILWTILYYLFNIFIYDIDYPGNSCAIFPLFVTLFWRFAICICFSFIAFIVVCIVQLLTAIFMIIWAPTRYLLRTIYDMLTLGIIKCLAKIPKTDSLMAWKISGPGLNKELFVKISIDDALTILRAKLEQIQLGEFRNYTTNNIEMPYQELRTLNCKVLSVLNTKIEAHERMKNNIQFLLNSLNNQISSRQSIFPRTNYSNVRFGEEELNIFLVAAQDMIKDFVESNKLISIWNTYHVSEGDFSCLTEKILFEIFTEKIMENVEDSSDFVEKEVKNIEYMEDLNRVQENANIKNFSSLAAKKRQKIAKKMDMDDIENFEIRENYLQARGSTGDKKFDDFEIRKVNLEQFLGYSQNINSPFTIEIGYLPKVRILTEKSLDLLLSPFSNQENYNQNYNQQLALYDYSSKGNSMNIFLNNKKRKGF